MFDFSLKRKLDEIKNLDKQITSAKESLNQLSAEIESKKEELGILSGIVEVQDLGIPYTPNDCNLSSIEQKKEKIQERLGEMMWKDEIIKTTRDYKVDGSYKKGRKFQETFCNNLLIGFNSYYEKKKKAITSQNFNKSINSIESKFDKMNKDAEIFGISINQEYLENCLELIQIELDEKLAKAKEKEKIKEEKRKLREEQQLLADAEKAKLALQKQRRMYEQSLSKALSEQERKEFEDKLKEIDKREADVDFRINNARAGYLYITATKSMPNICKLGVTRRLNPLVRIQELSSASTPFPFVCYGLVFSDNVFELETKIHNYFDDKRVNKENRHKEFFYITPKDAINVLQKEFGCEVHFVDINEQKAEDDKGFD